MPLSSATMHNDRAIMSFFVVRYITNLRILDFEFLELRLYDLKWKKMPSLLLVDKMWWNRTPCIAYVCSVQWKLCSTICVNACVDNQPSIRNIRSASGRTHLQFYQTINQKVHSMLFNWVFPMILSHQSRHSGVNFFQCNRNISKIYY